jgi:hypothetical protein
MPVVSVINNCTGSVCTVTNYSGTLLWNNGSTQASITVFTPGTYNVVQTVAGCKSLPALAVVPVVPYGVPVLSNNLSGPGGACRGESNIVFSVQPSPGAVSYNWSLPNGMSGTSTASAITVNMANNFNGGNICISAVNACGTSNTVCKNLVRIKQLPPDIASVSGPASICPQTMVTYFVPANATSTSYTWTVTSGLTIVSGQGSSSIVVLADPQFVSGKIKVKANNCMGSTPKVTKVVMGIPSQPIWKVSPPTTACPGSCYAFNIDNVHDATSWTFIAPPGCVITSPGAKSGNPISTSTSYAVVCFPAGFVSGNVTIYSSNGCGKSATLIYPIRSKPLAPSGITGQKNSLCGVTGKVYSISPVPDAVSYSWSVPSNAVIVKNDGTSITVDYMPGFTSGDICVRARNQCGYSAPVCMNVTIAPEQPTTVIGPLAVCKTQKSVLYKVLPVPDATGYAWSITGGAVVTGVNGTPNVTIRFTSAVNSVCTLSVKARNSCGSSISKKIVITVKNDCRIEEVDESAPVVNTFLAYPNPAHDKTQIVFESSMNAKYSLKLMDILGNVLLNQTIDGVEGVNTKDLDLSMYARGLYYAVIQGSGEEKHTYAIILE